MEDKKLQALFDSGMEVAVIARKMGRTVKAIRTVRATSKILENGLLPAPDLLNFQ
jgi:hypothetical protein